LFGLTQTILDEPGSIFKWFLIGPNEKGQTSPTFHIGLAPFWAIFEVAAYFELVDRNHGWKLFVLQNLYLLLHFARQSRTDTSLITVRDLSVRYDTYLKCIKHAKRAKWWFAQLYYEDRANYYFGKVKEAVFLLARKKIAPYSFDTIFERIFKAVAGYKRIGLMRYSWVQSLFTSTRKLKILLVVKVSDST